MDKIDRLLVIGDIHGKWDRFWNLYQKVGFNPEHDLMVFLGDYLDRGDNPVPVMDWVLEHFVCRDNGGKETYRAMEAAGRLEELTEAWLQLIEKMPLYAEVEADGHKYWFVHADCNPEQPLEKQKSKLLLWGRHLAMYPGLHQGEQTIVLGHTPVQALHLGSKPRWLSLGRLVLMDTGSFLEKGHISCADLLTQEVWQSD